MVVAEAVGRRGERKPLYNILDAMTQFQTGIRVRHEYGVHGRTRQMEYYFFDSEALIAVSFGKLLLTAAVLSRRIGSLCYRDPAMRSPSISHVPLTLPPSNTSNAGALTFNARSPENSCRPWPTSVVVMSAPLPYPLVDSLAEFPFHESSSSRHTQFITSLTNTMSHVPIPTSFPGGSLVLLFQPYNKSILDSDLVSLQGQRLFSICTNNVYPSVNEKPPSVNSERPSSDNEICSYGDDAPSLDNETRPLDKEIHSLKNQIWFKATEDMGRTFAQVELPDLRVALGDCDKKPVQLWGPPMRDEFGVLCDPVFRLPEFPNLINYQ